MSAGRASEYEGNVEIYGFTLDVIDYLHDCFQKLEAGHEEMIQSDPFYTPASGPISDEKVDELIKVIDARLNEEIDNYPAYHFRRSGADTHTDFNRLGPSARRAMAEGLMRIVEEHPLPPVPDRIVVETWSE